MIKSAIWSGVCFVVSIATTSHPAVCHFFAECADSRCPRIISLLNVPFDRSESLFWISFSGAYKKITICLSALNIACVKFGPQHLSLIPSQMMQSVLSSAFFTMSRSMVVPFRLSTPPYLTSYRPANATPSLVLLIPSLYLCRELDIQPSELVMVGNSFKSDIAPALSIGCSAIHIPAQSIWAHEKTEEYEHPKLRRISYFKEILDWI